MRGGGGVQGKKKTRMRLPKAEGGGCNHLDGQHIGTRGKTPVHVEPDLELANVKEVAWNDCIVFVLNHLCQKARGTGLENHSWVKFNACWRYQVPCINHSFEHVVENGGEL